MGMLLRLASFVILVMTVAACDQAPPAPPPKVQEKAATRWAEFTTVTPLPVNRRTHIATLGAGLIYWSQETEEGRDTVFAMNEGALPAATRLSSTAISEKLGQPSATGNIQSLVSGTDGRLYFTYAGGKGRKLLTAFGSFNPANGELKMVADTAALQSASGLGDSLVLARASLVRGTDLIWIWLRHNDGYALLTYSTAQAGGGLRRPFQNVTDLQQTIELTSPVDDVTTGPDNGLAYLDRKRSLLWKIDGKGTAAALQSVADLPKQISSPQVDVAGNVVIFASMPPAEPVEDDAVIGLDPAARKPSPWANFPAVIGWSDNKRILVDRDHIAVPARINVREMQLAELVRTKNGWLAYNSQTGDLLRMRLTEK